MIANMFTKQWY